MKTLMFAAGRLQSSAAFTSTSELRRVGRILPSRARVGEPLDGFCASGSPVLRGRRGQYRVENCDEI